MICRYGLREKPNDIDTLSHNNNEDEHSMLAQIGKVARGCIMGQIPLFVKKEISRVFTIRGKISCLLNGTFMKSSHQ